MNENYNLPDAVDLTSAGILDFQRRLEYLDLSEADRRRLRALRGVLNARSMAFVEAFYRHLFAFEETAQFLKDPELVARLKQAQQSHLESMLDANWDEAYAERRRRVGDTHARTGINPQIFLGAYNQYLQFCFREIAKSHSPESKELVEQLLSLQKAVFLDVELTLDAYYAHAMQSLRQALEIVFRANAELRQFAQLTSHDLKTPLATVANLCDEVLDEFGAQIPAAAREMIEKARSRVFRMSTTIDELLKSTATLPLEDDRTETSVDEAVAQALELVRPMLDERNIRVVVQRGLPRVVGDPVRIREAIYNLVSNAVKFIDKQPGRITIHAETRDRECIVCVADNGPGIPEDELPRIFVPFRRLPSHHDVPGSGLGLYFTKTLIEQQGGRVWAESTMGQGSRFFIALPQTTT